MTAPLAAAARAVYPAAMFRIESERLFIRPWNDGDKPAFVHVTADPEVTLYINNGKPFSDSDVDAFLLRQRNQIQDYGMCMGAVVEKDSGHVIGIAGTQPLGTTPDLEIGWILAREHWGRGYATEIGAAAMSHVLETLGRSRVVAIIDPENAASKRVAARLGMSLEGRYTGADLGHRFPEIVVDLFARQR